MKKLIGGLDLGTTGCKVTVFTEDGKRLGREYFDYPVRRGQTAHEIDASAIAEGVFTVLSAASRRFGPLSGLGVTSFGEAFVLVDDEGRPLRPILLCTDTRGAEECQEFAERFGADNVARIAGVKPNEMYSLPKLLWIRRHEPELFARVRHILLIEDYVVWLLTGDCRIDYSLATRTMAFDVRALAWSREILDAAGLPESLFSTPIPTGSVAGRVHTVATARTGLPAGTPVVVCGHDQVAAAAGAGVFEPGVAADGSGTVECITPVFGAVPETTRFQDDHYCVVPYFGQYVSYAFLHTGGVLLQWCVETLCKKALADAKAAGTSVYAALEGGDYAPTGLLVLPHFAGAATPHMDSGARGAIVGLSLGTTERDLYLACLEGIAYELRLNRDRLARSGIRVDRLVATGGGAKSRLWTQIKADILDLPIDALETEDAGTVGCAMMTGVAIGAFSDLAAAASVLVRKVSTFLPNPARTAEYDRLYTRYERLYDAVRPLV